MAGNGQKKLSEQEVTELLTQLQHASLRRECWSCECLQGFIAQLEHDATEGAKPLLEKHRVDPSHKGRGRDCEPCAPAEIFAAYLMHKRQA